MHDCLPRGFAGKVFRSVDILEEIKLITAAAAGVALLRNALPVARKRTSCFNRGEGLAIKIQHAIAGRHHYMAEAGGMESTCTWVMRGSVAWRAGA